MFNLLGLQPIYDILNKHLIKAEIKINDWTAGCVLRLIDSEVI